MPVVTFPVSLGETYYIAVDGAENTRAVFDVALANATLNDGPLPAGALGMLDFVNEIYKWGTSPTSLYSAPDAISLPEAVIPGLGAWVNWDAASAINILAAEFINHIAAGDYTVVIEFHGGTGVTPFVTLDGSDVYDQWVTYEVDGYIELDDVDGGRNVYQNETVFSPPGVPVYNIIAFTRTDTRIAFQVAYGEFAGTAFEDSGGAVVSTAASVYLAGDNFGPWDSILITRIVFYDAQANVDLPSLLTEELLTAPDNDNWADATTISVGDSLDGHNFRATDEAGQPNIGVGAMVSAVWYKFTAPSTASYTVSAGASGFDFSGYGTAIGVYTGAAVNALSEVGSNRGWPGASVTFAATSGTTYYIAVTGDETTAPGSAYGPFTISLVAA